MHASLAVLPMSDLSLAPAPVRLLPTTMDIQTRGATYDAPAFENGIPCQNVDEPPCCYHHYIINPTFLPYNRSEERFVYSELETNNKMRLGPLSPPFECFFFFIFFPFTCGCSSRVLLRSGYRHFPFLFGEGHESFSGSIF